MLFRKLPLVLVFLSLFAFACNDADDSKLDVFCDVEGAIECLDNVNGGAVHRVCADGAWDNTLCSESQQCQKSGCVEQVVVVCKTTENTCSDAKTVKICVTGQKPSEQACDNGFVCESGACVAAGVCKTTENTCFDEKTVKICVTGQKPREQACDNGFVCDLGACVASGVCKTTENTCFDGKTVKICVDGQKPREQACDNGLVCESGACVAAGVCKTTENTCSDAKSVKICVTGQKPTEQSCGEGLVCDLGACVASGVCKTTENTCFDDKTIKICVTGQKPTEQVCGDGLVCDLGACVASGVCKTTENTCFDDKTIKICVKGQKPREQVCGDGLVCDLGACVASDLCKTTENTCFDSKTVTICVKGQKPSQQSCVASAKCEAGACVDSCKNNRLDAGEEAVDCGGACAPCVACRIDSDCGIKGFCDSASGYVCSKRCRTNADCSNTKAWDGNYCRGDGRCSPKVFETVWGLTISDSTVVLPYNAKDLTAKCDFQILWGDELPGTDITKLPRVTDCVNVENRTHSYTVLGFQHIKIIGTYDGWGDFGSINLDKNYKPISAGQMLRNVVSFGPVGLSRGAFHGAQMLTELPKKDVPDASKLKDLGVCFTDAISFNAPIGHWDTSRVIDMGYMFESAKVFNQPIGNWNTSSVIDMSRMFYGARSFDQPIGSWDTSNVLYMKEMFYKAIWFNQDLQGWFLRYNVDLKDMFLDSRMSKANLCLLKAKGGAWLDVAQVSGAGCQ